MITEALRSAIEDSGLGPYAIARESGVDDVAIRQFLAGDRDPRLGTADKIAVVVGLRLAPASQRPGSEARDDDPKRPISNPLLSEVAGCGLCPYALSRKAGLKDGTVRQFLARQSDMQRLSTAEKLAAFLGLVAGRVPRIAQVGAPQIIADSLRSAIKDSGLGPYALSRATGINNHAISQFLAGGSDPQLGTADKIAVVVGLRLAPASRDAPESIPRTMREALRSAIEDSGLGSYAIARESGVNDRTIRQFLAGDDLRLSSAEKLAALLGLGAVRVAMSWHPEPATPISDPLQPFMDSLRSAIDVDGRSPHALAKLSGISFATIYRFTNVKFSLKYTTAVKLADALGLKLEPAMLQARPAESSALAAEPAPFDPPTVVRRCPVELAGEGFPIHVDGQVVPMLTGIAYALLEFAVERYREGGVCLAHELSARTTSTSNRPIRSLLLKLKETRYAPLARHVEWDGRKGGRLQIVDTKPHV